MHFHLKPPAAQRRPTMPKSEHNERVDCPPYKFYFDKTKDSWICSVHGEVDLTAWVNCWNGCDEGFFDDYEDDPIECEPGEISTCSECKGKGGWRVCGVCNEDNPDAEW